MRAFGLLLLCVALALQGVAQARGVKQPCPMEQSGHAIAVDVAVDAQQPDCCNDAATAAKTGQPCKTGAECQSASACLLVAGTQYALRVAAPQPLRIVEPLAPADTPTSVWRPPALI